MLVVHLQISRSEAPNYSLQSPAVNLQNLDFFLESVCIDLVSVNVNLLPVVEVEVHRRRRRGLLCRESAQRGERVA